MKARLRRLLPAPAWGALRAAGLAVRTSLLRCLDAVEGLLGRRPELLPPRHLRFVGRGDFERIGDRFLGHFTELCGLRPDERVLDVGCGIGRMALALTRYLDGGTYRGFDVVPDGIRWCTERITPRFPAFRFELADIRNGRYNPDGGVPAAEYRFPYPDDSFDFALATSVFTHMLPSEVANYLGELARVLAPGGRCLATYFLIDEDSAARIETGASDLLLEARMLDGDAPYRALDAARPEDAIGLDEELVRRLHLRAGLPVRDPIHRGSWCGRSGTRDYQDLVIADAV